MKLLQITSSIGIINSILLFNVCKKRFLLNTLLTSTSFYVHKDYPVMKCRILLVDKVLANIVGITNYYYCCTYYDTYLWFGEHHFVWMLCILSYMEVKRSSSRFFHTLVHVCWHVSTFAIATDLIKKQYLYNLFIM